MKNIIALAVILVVGMAVLMAVDTAPSIRSGGAPPTEAELPRQPVAARPAARHLTDAAPAGNSETVAGIRVRKDRNCEVERQLFVTPGGETFDAYRCLRQAPRQPHPYAHYDNDSLEVLAWSDAAAAALLGRRLVARDRHKSYEMMLRATALDGDISHLAWLADQAFSAIRINGETHVANVKRRYELAALASRLGGDPATPSMLRNLLVDAGLGADSLELLDERVDTMLQSVRDIQRSVHGEVRYGGLDDA